MASSYTDAQGNTRTLPVATRDVIVHDDALDIDRQLLAGQPVPPELIDAYQAKVGDTGSRAEAGRDDTAAVDEELTGDDLANRAAELKIKGRSSMTADELRDAVAKAEADQAGPLPARPPRAPRGGRSVRLPAP
jgi:hypothetical protein